MVSPAVAAPPATPGIEGGSPPAPAGEPQVTPSTPPQGAPGQAAPSEPGKGGKEPAGGGDPQNQPGNSNEPNPTPSQPPAPSPQEPPKMTEAEWQRQQAAARKAFEEQEWESKAKELHTSGPVKARDLLDTLAEELDVRIPADLRKPLIDLVNDLVTHADKGAELKVKGEWEGKYNDAAETLQDTSLAFLGAMDDAGMRGKFAEMVRGKDPSTWVKALIDVKRPSIAAKALENAATAQAALLPEGEVRDGFTAKVKGETDPKKLAQAFHDALLGVVGPSGEPRVAARGGGNGRPSLAEVTRRRSAGEYKSDKEFLDDQNLALGIQA